MAVIGNLISSDKQFCIFGTGVTGLSVAKFLKNRGKSFLFVDTREIIPNRELIEKEFPGSSIIRNVSTDKAVQISEPDEVESGGLATNFIENLLEKFSDLILSPGVPRSHPLVERALGAKKRVYGDIALFLEHAKAPVVGITGTNGKTTVASLMGIAAEAAGKRVAVGGNIGLPALDMLNDELDLYVLELSSFQLESLEQAKLDVACVLNVSEDHLDRYSSFAAYCMAKQRIYYGAKAVVYKLSEPLTQPPSVEGVKRFGFAKKRKVEENEIQVFLDEKERGVVIQGRHLGDIEGAALLGEHNRENLLAVIALSLACELPLAEVLPAIKAFPGLPHRCEKVAEKNGVVFVNDSKATNVGATKAALEGLAPQFSNIMLIAGGEGKGADFATLGQLINRHVAMVTVIGKDGDKIAQQVKSPLKLERAETMQQAVEKSWQAAKSGDCVLLSPACASLDMYSNYEARGASFAAAVERVTQ